MTKVSRSILSRSIWMPLVLGLAACDVQIRDETPAEFKANHDIGMYEIKVSVTRGALVSPASVHVTGLSGENTVELEPKAGRTTWSALYPIRCRSSFPLQFRAIWTVQNISTRMKLEPAQPREIRLIEPEPVREVNMDTSSRSRTGWDTMVSYRFVTAPNTLITAARIEPFSDAEADVTAAKALSVTTPTPIEVPCGEPVQIGIHSDAQRAHGKLVIETNNPQIPRWETRIEFAPVENQAS